MAEVWKWPPATVVCTPKPGRGDAPRACSRAGLSRAEVALPSGQTGPGTPVPGPAPGWRGSPSPGGQASQGDVRGPGKSSAGAPEADADADAWARAPQRPCWRPLPHPWLQCVPVCSRASPLCRLGLLVLTASLTPRVLPQDPPQLQGLRPGTPRGLDHVTRDKGLPGLSLKAEQSPGSPSPAGVGVGRTEPTCATLCPQTPFLPSPQQGTLGYGT